MRKAKTIMSLALSVAMVTSMAATAPVMAAESESTDGFNLNLCIASEPQSIDPALNTAMDGSVMCHHMFEGLVKWADDGEGNAVTVPGQAESWDKETNDDAEPVTKALSLKLSYRLQCRKQAFRCVLLLNK